MKINKETRTIINAICKDLRVEEPKIIRDNTFYGAAYLPEEDRIHVNSEFKNRELVFLMAHELRHKWQLNNTLIKKQLTDYKNPFASNCSTKEYEMQFVEIDANAYASIIVQILYGTDALRPSFEGDVMDLIVSRMKGIIQEREKIEVIPFWCVFDVVPTERRSSRV